MSFARELAFRAGLLEHRREKRFPAQELNASYPAGSRQKRVRVKNISISGLYLYTRDHWPPGTTVNLTLQQRSVIPDHKPAAVRIRTRSVRLGMDGVGLVFEPEHVAPDVWTGVMVKAAGVSVHQDSIQVLRVSKALSFLRRVSPVSEPKVLDHIAGESVYETGERAVDTILNAESLVESWNLPIRTGVSPNVVLGILQNASRAADDAVRHHWAGLLASSAQYWARDRESLYFVALLARLDPVQIRILDAACSRALRAERHAGYYFPPKLTCSREMMRSITGISDLFTVEQHLDRLYHFDLLQRTTKRSAFDQIEQANLTPTDIGLKLYVRCRGLLEPPDAPVRTPPKPVIHFPQTSKSSEPASREKARKYAPAI
jgi:hypothetical protein